MNRTTTTNFEFLNLDWDLRETYYERAKFIEDFFVHNDYDKVIEQVKKYEQVLAKKEIFLSTDKLTGNSYEDALMELKALYQALKKVAIEKGQRVEKNFEIPNANKQYQTNERKLIYIQTADNSSGNWKIYEDSEKIGDATANSAMKPLDTVPNSKFLRDQANNRIRSYMTTSGVPFKVDWVELAYRPESETWFRDHDVHEVLQRSGYKKNDNVEGNEWWNVSLDDAKKAIEAVKENREVIDGPKIDSKKIVLRPEQKEAVSKTRKIFKNKNRMLWNAKMRFGKTLSAYQLIKEEGYKTVLILTHRPVVSDSWFDDFMKLKMDEEGYRYGSKKGESIESLLKDDTKFVYFASIQDLRGSSQIGGKQGEKNEAVFATNWDLIVFDEAHEGTQTELAQRVEQAVIKKNTKVLELSGTPFNLLDQYSEEQVFTWDYVMEQEAKLRWSVEKPEEPNPYEALPKVNMFTFEMSNKERYADDNKAFNFKEFFRVNDDGSFEHESDVNAFLNEITKKSKTNYPYSTEEYRNELRHTLWLLPGIAEARALKRLMDRHPVFGKEYKIINVVDKDDKEITSKDDPDLARVRSAISDKPWETKTITLTVRKLTTGVNVKEWTAVMFLNNTTSAMNYLQAAFRAQTPYSNKVQGQKTNAYIFDFAPDRALTVMAESASVNSQVGKRNTLAQKRNMAKMLNFLPILGMDNNSMRQFSVDRMLTQLKKVYAERAVRSGFEDDSLYSDALLTISEDAAELFEKLRGIVGKTGATKGSKKVNVNNQGLTDEEYETADKASKKPKKSRTPEEIAAFEKLKEAKRERRNAISILRGISIRIPLMIFGMKVDISKDVDIDTFINEVDDISWEEFMPAGVTKEMFREQAKYYDPEVFIEAGRIIRSRAKACDELTYVERAEQIALLHGTFKNPDKETVLTPWRVVNMQLSSTIGGLSYYSDDFSDTTVDGKSALKWIENKDTKNVYKDDGRVLEINSKTGLYPLLVATSFFYKKQMEFISDNAGKINKRDEEKIIQEILKNNIFVIAKTPMAKTITQRTLAGYKDWKINIKYIPQITEKIKNNVGDVIEDIRGDFGTMKFDAVVGNPPYNENDNGKRDDGAANPSAKPLYNLFFELGKNISDRYISMIFPARWLAGAGKGLAKFSNEMLNDKHIRQMTVFKNSAEVFPNTSIKGGVLYLTYDLDYEGKADIIFNDSDGYKSEFTDYLNSANSGVFMPYGELISIYKKVSTKEDLSSNSIQKITSTRKPYGLATDFFSNPTKYNLPEIFTERHEFDDIEIIGLNNKKRALRYVPKDYPISVGVDSINKWKLFVGKAIGDGIFGEKVPDFPVGGPGQIATETFIRIGEFDTQYEAESLRKYYYTKFFRAMLGILKTTQDAPARVYAFVPLQDFSTKEFNLEDGSIDWTKSISEIDQQLYQKYELDEKEIEFINTKVEDCKIKL